MHDDACLALRTADLSPDGEADSGALAPQHRDESGDSSQRRVISLQRPGNVGKRYRENHVAASGMQPGAVVAELLAKACQHGVGHDSRARRLSWSCPELHPADIHQAGVPGPSDMPELMEPIQGPDERARGHVAEVCAQRVNGCAPPPFNGSEDCGLTDR